MFHFISIHWFGVKGGFLWLVCAGWSLAGFSGGFSFVSWVFLLCFALLPIHLWGFWDLFSCRAASALSLWVTVLFFHELSSLLLCFPSALLLYVNHFS